MPPQFDEDDIGLTLIVRVLDDILVRLKDSKHENLRSAHTCIGAARLLVVDELGARDLDVEEISQYIIDLHKHLADHPYQPTFPDAT